MDNDDIRRGKFSTHKKFDEATAVLAGNSLLMLAFEIIGSSELQIKDKAKSLLIYHLSKCSGHTGVAGGQYLDLRFEHKKISHSKIVDMQIKKTGKLFSFCCIAPAIIKEKKISVIKDLVSVGSNIGLLFQVADDLLDYKGSSKDVGKKTKKDVKSGKATLINLIGHDKSIKFAYNLKNKIISKLKKYGRKSKNLIQSLEIIISRSS
jgi:geranylgeranyl pyrophosphate synthase